MTEETTENTTEETTPTKTRATSDYFLMIFTEGGVCDKCQSEEDDGRVITSSGVVHKFKAKADLQRALNQMGAKPADDDEDGILVLDCGCEAIVIHGKLRTIRTRTVTALD